MPPKKLTGRDYAKLCVINRRGRARVARGQPYFIPRSSVGQALQSAHLEVKQENPVAGPSTADDPVSATTTTIKAERTRTEEPAGDPVTEIQNFENYATMDTTDAPTAIASGSENVTAGGEQGSTSNELIMWKTPINHERVISFSRTVDLFSWAHQFYWESIKMKSKVVGKFLTTSFMYIFNNSLCSYLSPADWETLPPYAKALDLNVDVKFMGAEASFETGTTLSGNALMNHIIYGGISVGLNKEFNVLPRKVEYNNNTMTLAGTTTSNIQDYKKMLYGDEPGGTDCNADFPAALGLPRNNIAYTSIVTNYSDEGDGNVYGSKNCGAPDLGKFVSKFKAEDAKGHTFSWNYKPHMGILKCPPKFHGIIMKGDKYINYSSTFPGQEFLLGSNGNGSIDISDSITPSGKLNVNCYDQIIEKSGFKSGLNNIGHVSFPESFSIGLFPVPNNCLNCANTYVNCKGHWNVTFNIVMEIGRDSHTTYGVTQAHNR